jgi:hypothetical protein
LARTLLGPGWSQNTGCCNWPHGLVVRFAIPSVTWFRRAKKLSKSCTRESGASASPNAATTAAAGSLARGASARRCRWSELAAATAAVQLASWTRCQVRHSLGDLVSACEKVVQILYTGIWSLGIAECSDDSGGRDARTWGQRRQRRCERRDGALQNRARPATHVWLCKSVQTCNERPGCGKSQVFESMKN